jgi:hypothetical protein
MPDHPSFVRELDAIKLGLLSPDFGEGRSDALPERTDHVR